MYGYHRVLIYFKCRNCTFSALGTHSLILPHRENRGRSGAGSPACGAVGGADWGKECRAGASPRQWDPRGTCRLVSPPFLLCRSDGMVQRACGRSHASDFPRLSQEMLNSMSCPGKGHPSPVLPSHFSSRPQTASSHRKPESIYYLAGNLIPHSSVPLHKQRGRGFLISRNSLILAQKKGISRV